MIERLTDYILTIHAYPGSSERVTPVVTFDIVCSLTEQLTRLAIVVDVTLQL